MGLGTFGLGCQCCDVSCASHTYPPGTVSTYGYGLSEYVDEFGDPASLSLWPSPYPFWPQNSISGGLLRLRQTWTNSGDASKTPESGLRKLLELGGFNEDLASRLTCQFYDIPDVSLISAKNDVLCQFQVPLYDNALTPWTTKKLSVTLRVHYLHPFTLPFGVPSGSQGKWLIRDRITGAGSGALYVNTGLSFLQGDTVRFTLRRENTLGQVRMIVSIRGIEVFNAVSAFWGRVYHDSGQQFDAPGSCWSSFTIYQTFLNNLLSFQELWADVMRVQWESSLP